MQSPPSGMLMHHIVSPAYLDDYIRDHKLPEDKVQAEQVTRRCKNYVLVGDKLYDGADHLEYLWPTA
jgi:hypothetical protein